MFSIKNKPNEKRSACFVIKIIRKWFVGRFASAFAMLCLLLAVRRRKMNLALDTVHLKVSAPHVFSLYKRFLTRRFCLHIFRPFRGLRILDKNQ